MPVLDRSAKPTKISSVQLRGSPAFTAAAKRPDRSDCSAVNAYLNPRPAKVKVAAGVDLVGGARLSWSLWPMRPEAA